MKLRIVSSSARRGRQTTIFTLIALSFVVATISLPLYAQHQHAESANTSSKAMTSTWSKAEVRKIDTVNNKITLKHGEIQNLDMPPMTMVFVAQDAKLIAGVKAGDRVRFKAANIDGVFVVTDLKRMKK